MKPRRIPVPILARPLLALVISTFIVWTATAQTTAVNQPPTAQDLSVTLIANTFATVHLNGSDLDGNALTFQVSSPPGHGVLSGTPPNLTYTPRTNFVGVDSFTYFAYDGTTNSQAATVSISVKNGVSINNVTLAEGDTGTTNAVFTVTLAAPPTENITVNFETVDVTATAGTDYLPTSGTLLFTVLSAQTQTISVPIMGDRVVEPDEEFGVVLTASTNVVVLNGTGQGIILNDDAGAGTGVLTPELAAVKVHERLNYSLTWTHPEEWRALNTIDLIIIDDTGPLLAIRWTQSNNTFALCDSNTGKFTQLGQAGSKKHFESPEAVFYLEDSGSVGSGKNVTIRYSLSFKPKAAGSTYSIETFTTDLNGNEQGFDQLGALTITKK